MPPPDPTALALSDALLASIRHTIDQSPDGAIAFSRFMDLALYSPGLGYYSAGASKFGQEGDFITAPEISPLFSQTCADAFIPCLQQLGPDSRLVEIGAGSGAFARTVLERMNRQQTLPACYSILETSADLRARQREYMMTHLPEEIVQRVEWLDRPLTSGWKGILFANEVVDALPATRFLVKDGAFYEEMVTMNSAGALACTYRPASDALCTYLRQVENTIGRRLAEGYRSECLPQLPAWLRAITAGLEQGIVILMDYGFPRSEYYHPDRCEGTRRAYFRHRVHNNVYQWPGLQDITASVDFTALAEAGYQAGLALEGYCSLSQFLRHHGLDQRLIEASGQLDADDMLAQQRLHSQMRRLLFPEHMGECFQVIAFSLHFAQEGLFPCQNLTWRL